MLAEVHRLLKVGGTYVIFSLNTEELLGPLLRTKALGYEVSCYKINKKSSPNQSTDCTHQKNIVNSDNSENSENSEDNRNTGNKTDSNIEDFTRTLETELENNKYCMGTVVICKKINNNTIDIDQLCEEEKIIMDTYFKIEMPFLTK